MACGGRIIGNKLPLPFACSGKSKLFRTFWQDYRAKALLHSERDTCKHEFPFSATRTYDHAPGKTGAVAEPNPATTTQRKMDYPRGVIHLSWLRGQDLVTFRDPETSRLKTSFHRKVSLANCHHGSSHLRPAGRSFNLSHNQEKSPTKVGLFSWLRGQDLAERSEAKLACSFCKQAEERVYERYLRLASSTGGSRRFEFCTRSVRKFPQSFD